MSRVLTVDDLLAMYGQYEQLLESQRAVEKQLARAQLRGEETSGVRMSLDTLTRGLQELSDSMTFDTPRIWVEYKYRAYADSSQPIATMHDFRLHCSKPGYICTTRYAFLEAELERLGEPSLSDKAAYPDERDLMHVLDGGVFDVLDDTFLRAWRQHEYFRDDTGAVAKWAQLL